MFLVGFRLASQRTVAEMASSPPLHRNGILTAAASLILSLMRRAAEPQHFGVEPKAKRARLVDVTPAWNKPEFADVLIHLDPELPESGLARVSVHAHRVFLAAASPFFTKLFTSGMAETGAREVTLKVPVPELAASLIEWLYTGEHKGIPSPADLMALWHLADRFDLGAIREMIASTWTKRPEVWRELTPLPMRFPSRSLCTSPCYNRG